jgi:WD40 repeat protein/predicted Ser/Thr protein kinase
MSTYLSCPRGHRWETPAENGRPAGGRPPACPVCGTPADPSLAVADSDQETVPPRTPPPNGLTAALAPTAVGAGGAAPAVSEPAGYQILSELGRGGMGVVYLARQVRLKRLVALKMILAGAHAADQERTRFRTEAEAVARLQHSNVVQIYEVGEHDGRPYIALEFLDGGTLAERIRRAPVRPPEAAALVETLARAVHAAHQQGVIHRDLKPTNVLLTRAGVPKVTDFGLAKQLDSEAGLTQSGAILGTPSYMAPEQAGGKGRRVGAPADVYALGAILYELLTGRPPFQAESPFDTVVQVVSREPVPPRQLQRRCPRDLETICLKCLQKEPARRYASALALAEDLRRFLEGQPIRARRVGLGARLWRWGRRNPVVTGLVTLLLLAGVGLVGLFVRLRDTEDVLRRPRPLAAEPAEIRRPARPLATLRGHQDLVTGVAFHPNSRRVASASKDGTVRVWDPAAAREVRKLTGHEGAVLGVAFSPDGRELASAGIDGTVKVWQAGTGRKLLDLRRHTGLVWAVAFSPDGRHLASAGDDRVLILWDRKGQPVHVWRDHPAAVRAVAFSSDSNQVAAGCKPVQIWDVTTGQAVCTLTGHTGRVNAVAYSPDGSLLLSAGTDRTVRVWEAKTGRSAHVFRGHRFPIHAAAFSSGGGQVVSANKRVTDRYAKMPEQGTAIVKIWEARSGVEINTLAGIDTEVTAVACSPDGGYLACAGAGKTVTIWDARALGLLGHPDGPAIKR